MVAIARIHKDANEIDTDNVDTNGPDAADKKRYLTPFLCCAIGTMMVACDWACTDPHRGADAPVRRPSSIDAVQLDQHLFAAVAASRHEEVGLILAKGGDPNAVDFYGQTPLHIAAHHGCTRCAEMLISEGGMINGSPEGRLSPLYEAAAGGHSEMVVLLLENGADIDRRHTIWQDSALHRAAEGGHAQTVATLLRAGASPNLRNHADQTALHRAAFWGHLDVLRILLAGGVDPSIKDNTQATAADTAAGRGQTEAARLLMHE